MPSFDIVSKLKKDEVQNAVDNANRELQTRYDFRGVEASFNFDKAKNEVKLEADEEFQIQQMDDIFRQKLIKDAKLKVDAKINDDIVRVTGKKRDDLQATIALVRGSKIEQPLQYENFRD